MSNQVMVLGDDEAKRLIVEYRQLSDRRAGLLGDIDFSALAGDGGINMASVMGLMGKVDVLKQAYEITNRMEVVAQQIIGAMVGRLK